MGNTRWWYALVTVAVLNVTWSLAGVLSDETITFGPATLWVVLGGSVLLLAPVFYYALYREIDLVRDGGSSWEPDPRAWVGGGISLSLIGSVVFLNPMIHYVTALYLLQRVRKRSTFDPTARTDR